MVMHDWNSDKKYAVLLIHPMLSSGNGMREYIAKYWGDVYRILAPDLSAHGDALHETYPGAKGEAEQIHHYLISHNAAHLKLGYGASLGGVVLLQLLNYKDLQFDHLFFEGTSFFDSRLLNGTLRSEFLKRHKRAVNNPAMAKQKMAAMFGEEVAPLLAEHFIGMDEKSIVNMVRDCTIVKPPVLPESMQKKCTFAYGEKDFDYKRAAKVLPGLYPFARIEVWKGCGHCERLSKDSERYASMLNRLCS